ncbi:ricin B-like lectin [Ephemerocybe angulata]|uniref:Ricin B-like lectin n=1 Tax=Ephemerocybe angulata TaxID=980116 RepID=A0A8H6HJW6_9AGAR|nr:ricin B-like lectin [Tulosesus angulatus]
MAEKIQTGLTFMIRNVRSGTLIDVSPADKRSIVGFPQNNGPSQKWTANWTGGGWTLRSGNVYLALAVVPADGAHLVASPAPFEWHIWHDQVFPGTYRIFAPRTIYNLDLWNYGDQTPGTIVTLWHQWNGAHQLWEFVQV